MAWTKEQEIAIHEKGTNIIVSAGAGSGKTAVLTARTMRILKSGIHINELLILTFTSSAAAEMKERIRKNIIKEMENKEDLKEELELIDQAYITTFDSFALSIVKKYHYHLNIDRDIKITDASMIELLKKKTMEEVFALFYKEKQKDFQKLILDFCMKDDKDLKKSLIKIASKIDGLPNKEEYLENYSRNFFSEEHLDSLADEYETIVLQKIEDLNKQREQLSFYVDSYLPKLDAVIRSLCCATSLEEVYAHCFIDRLPNLPNGSDEEVKQEKEKLKAIIEDIKNTILTYGTKEEVRKKLQKTKSHTEIIISIIREYLTRLHTYKKEKAIYDFEDVALLAIKIVKNFIEVREEIKETFKEIMIDEYQDTNDIQETFISYIENQNVYMVGDIKQSIYRFRNANPYLFKSKYDCYTKKQKGMKIDLVKNFRSRKEVLENINEVFNLIMDNRIGGAEYHESHQMVYGNTSYTEEGYTEYNYKMRILEYEEKEEKKYTKEEIEIFTIAKDIKDKINSKYQVFDKDKKLLKPITYNDFVILMDRTSSFDLYKKIFAYVGIPLTLYKDDKLNDSDDINIIKNSVDLLLKVKENTLDNAFKYDFISLARSYLYHMSDQDIFMTIKENCFKETELYSTFYSLSQKVDSSSISVILEEIMKVTNIYEKLITVGNINESIIRLSKLLDTAKNLEEIGYDIYDFNTYLKDLQEESYDMKYTPSYTSGNSVKIMTIHKSKGLEFPICYYSGLYKVFNISDLKERVLYSNIYGIITPIVENGIEETITKYLVKYHYLEEEVAEKIRLFYVALTRAKEQMILITPKVDAKKTNKEENHTIEIASRRNYKSFSSILNSIKEELLPYYEDVNLEDLNLTKEYLYNKSKLNKVEVNKKVPLEIKEFPTFLEAKVKVEKKHFSKEINQLIDKETYKNIELGLKVHEILEHIDFINPNYEDIENAFLKEKVRQFLASKLLENKEQATIYKEYEFLYEKNKIEYHGIIDLMMEYEDSIDIIDYKLSNTKEEAYVNQLNGYKEYIETISKKKVNIYLFSILKGTIEKVD